MSQENQAPLEEKTEEKAAVKENVKLRVRGGDITAAKSDLFADSNLPKFSVGDTVKVHYKIKEGDKERVQVYEGTVISIRGEGFGKTFNVRRISHEVGVERIFPFHNPSIAKVEVTRKGFVRRAKLYFLRHKSGKAGRIKESYEGQVALAQEKKKARGEKASKAKA